MLIKCNGFLQSAHLLSRIPHTWVNDVEMVKNTAKESSDLAAVFKVYPSQRLSVFRKLKTDPDESAVSISI